MKSIIGKYDKRVFWATMAAAIALCAAAMLLGDGAIAVTEWAKLGIYEKIDWALALYAVGCVGFLLFVSFSKWGSKKLGAVDDEPEYSTFTWAAMLMCCGVAVGVFFWSVAEPLYHYMQTPYLTEAQSPEAVSVSLGIVDFNWGICIWALYAVIGLAIGISAYRHGGDFSFSSAFSGFGGLTKKAGIAQFLNFVCSFFTIIGLSISLGMGTLSISYGISRVFGFDCGVAVDMVVLLVVGAVFAVSSIRGIKRGMARVSNAAIIITLGLLLFILLCGPTSFILRTIVESMGIYIQYFPVMAFFTDPSGQTDGWPLKWTLFYYAWALTWTPYVGGFFAKISKGRTIREFCIGTMMLPTIISIAWFGTVGGATLGMFTDGVADLWTSVQAQTESGFFVLLDQLPLSSLTSCVVLVDLVLFMATSCDGAVNYVSLILSREEGEPKIGLKLLVAAMMVVCPLALIIGGGLETIRNVALIAGVPFIALGVMAMVSSKRLLKNENQVEEDALVIDFPKSV